MEHIVRQLCVLSIANAAHAAMTAQACGLPTLTARDALRRELDAWDLRGENLNPEPRSALGALVGVVKAARMTLLVLDASAVRA